MALTYPLPFALLADCLTGPEIEPELKRFDEMSGAGDGRHWAAAMSDPLWTASYDLYATTVSRARRINALVNSLDGPSKTLLWMNPFYSGPAAGLKAASSPTVSGIRAADRGAVAMAGLAPGQVISVGDYISMQYAGRYYMGQFAEGGTANASGALGQLEIRPYLPIGLNVGAAIELIKPVFTAMVIDYKPFKIYRDFATTTASITLMQKP